jgi:predicted nuclease with TOPRIM domain
VAKREWELQGKEQEITRKLERESSELKSHPNNLSTHEAALEAEQECLRKMREDLCNCELTIPSQEGAQERRAIALTFNEGELTDKEKWLAEIGLQELATTCKTLEELQAVWTVEAQKVWDFLGQTEVALAPLDFSPVRSGEPAQEVNTVLPVLDSMGAKMLTLEESSASSWRPRVMF